MIQSLTFRHSAGLQIPIELLRLSALRKRDPGISTPTRLDFHILQFVTRGSGRHWLDGEPVELRPGEVLHIRPSQVHWFDGGAGHEAFLLLFLPEAAPDAGALESLNLHLTAPLTCTPDEFELLLGLLRKFERLQSKPGAIRPGHVGPWLLGAIIAAIADLLPQPHVGEQGSERGPLRLVHAFERLLEAHHASQRNLAWYVARLNTTARTLHRACQAVRGLSPKRLLDARIGLEAKRKLMLSADTVEAIAFSLGFSESTNFVKFFKRVSGQTPEEFRRTRAGRAAGRA